MKQSLKGTTILAAMHAYGAIYNKVLVPWLWLLSTTAVCVQVQIDNWPHDLPAIAKRRLLRSMRLDRGEKP